ncbi:hypothetical protein NFI96_005109 [Prochilodus magdalenae]|nr:hypothetical protein NFI96_005109 [Prochilodus magdalenae]
MQYSSALTHYPASSRKVLITVTTSRGNKPLTEGLSCANAANAEEPGRSMPAFVCYEAAASMRPHFYTSRAEIVITRPDGVEKSVPIHVLKQGRLEPIGSTTQSELYNKPGLASDHFDNTNCKLDISDENDDICENGSVLESLSRRNCCKALEQKEEPVCINNDVTAHQGSSQRTMSRCSGEDLPKAILPYKDQVRLEHQQTEEEEEGEAAEEPVFELQILREPNKTNNRSGLNEKVSHYLAEVERQNKYLQDKKKYRFHIIPDGNCLYRAVSKAAYGDQSMHKDLREQTVHHIADHLDEFSPIIEGDVGEFLINAAQDGAWAGYPELLAMSQMLNVNIYLTTGGSLESPTVSTMMHYLGEEDLTKPAIWLSWLSNGHYDVLLDHSLPNPEYDNWCCHMQVQRKRDEDLAKSMAASLSRMFIIPQDEKQQVIYCYTTHVIGFYQIKGQSSPTPPNVASVSVKARTETELTLEWSKVNNGTYILKYINGTEIPLTVSMNGAMVTCTVSSLSAGTKYNFTLYTVLKGVRSSGLQFAVITSPSNVVSVSVKARSEVALTLEWKKLVNRFSYIYILRHNKTEMYTPLYWGGSIATHTVSSLSPGTKYNFTLYTVFGGERSSGYNFSAVTMPVSVPRVNVTQRNENYLVLSWEKVKSNNISYILNHTNGTETLIADSDNNSSEVTFTVTSLSPGTKYTFTLYTVFDGVRSRGLKFSAVTVSLMVTGLRCEYGSSGSALVLIWNAPGGAWTGVEVVVKGRSPQYWKGTRLEVHGLQPACWYNVTLKLFLGDIRSAPVSISCQTDPRGEDVIAGVIAGAVLAVLFIVFLICLGVCVNYRQSTRNRKSRRETPSGLAPIQELEEELSENPVQFENASNVNNVFFDEANKQVFAVRSGGATGVVVKGPEDKSPIAFRMDDKGEVKCIKFSLGNKILAVQRTPKSVDFINFIPEYPHLEFSQECKTKNASILGFCWTNWNEIVFVTDQGIEFYQVLPDKRTVKMLKSQSINVNWYMYCPETAVLLLSTTVQGNVLQPFAFRNLTMSKMTKFEIELPVVPKPAKLNLSERDIAVATIYGQLYVMYLKHHSRTTNSSGAEVVLYHLPREGPCKKTHVLKLNTTGKFALNVVDNLVVVHHQSSQAMESGPSRYSNTYKRPVRTQAVIDQSDMYTHVLSAFTEKKDMSHKFIIAVLMEYIRSLNQFQITVQHYLYELVIKTLVQHNLFYMLHQFLQYHVLSDSKPLACLLLSLESTYPPAHQLSLDMLKRLSTANDEIVEVLLSKQQVLGALRFVRSVGGHDNVSARKFLDAARQTSDTMLFYTIFRFFEQRNLRLRGNPAFNPGEHCEEHVAYFKEVFGEQTLMKAATV